MGTTATLREETLNLAGQSGSRMLNISANEKTEASPDKSAFATLLAMTWSQQSCLLAKTKELTETG